MPSSGEYWECSGQARFDFEQGSDQVTSRGVFQHKLLHHGESVPVIPLQHLASRNETGTAVLGAGCVTIQAPAVWAENWGSF